MTVRLRSFVKKDLSELVALFNTVRKGSYEFMPLTEEEVFARTRGDASKVLIAEDNEEIAGSVTYSNGHWGEEIRWLAVYSRPDKKVIEDTLAEEAEKLVQGESVFTSIESDSPRIKEWTDRGYNVDGGLYQMIARLDLRRPVPPIPEGTILRNMEKEEGKKTAEMVNGVFGWERLTPDFAEKARTESPPFSEEWVHLAEVHQKIVSVVAAWPAVKYNRYFGAKRGYLGPAATVVEFRSKKLASALTVRAMNFLYERGMNEVVLHTSERNIPSITLLRNIGFEIGYRWKFLRKYVKQKADQNRCSDSNIVE